MISKIRPIIDKSGSLFLVVIAVEDTKHEPVALLDKETIQGMTYSFENFLRVQL
jgi:hypothetical protein